MVRDKGFESFICKTAAVHTDEAILTEDGTATKWFQTLSR